jgi:hypothetical protein
MDAQRCKVGQLLENYDGNGRKQDNTRCERNRHELAGEMNLMSWPSNCRRHVQE